MKYYAQYIKDFPSRNARLLVQYLAAMRKWEERPNQDIGGKFSRFETKLRAFNRTYPLGEVSFRQLIIFYRVCHFCTMCENLARSFV